MFSVREYTADVIEINSLEDARNEIRKIKSGPKSIEIMAPKAVSKVIKLENVVLQDAIIIKQDMLSIGGEVAVPKKTFELKEKEGDILIIGSLKQIRELVKKLKRHYSRIKKIADKLDKLLDEIICQK